MRPEHPGMGNLRFQAGFGSGRQFRCLNRASGADSVIATGTPRDFLLGVEDLETPLNTRLRGITR